MKFFIVLVAALALAAPAMGKTFTRCSLAREMYALGVPKSELPQWTCIAEHESSYRTNVVGPTNSNGSNDYGIFNSAHTLETIVDAGQRAAAVLPGGPGSPALLGLNLAGTGDRVGDVIGQQSVTGQVAFVVGETAVGWLTPVVVVDLEDTVIVGTVGVGGANNVGALTDNISNSVTCARKIKSQQGWTAWSTWKYCSGSLPSINDCF
uniref:Lysozyme 1-like n=1 Tax=Musca domestica TaxID=7370 RepID=A0A9J7IE81_MUSDO